MDEERRPDGLDRVRRQWEHLRIARERAENERRQREAFGTCTTSTSLDVTCATCVRMDALVCARTTFSTWAATLSSPAGWWRASARRSVWRWRLGMCSAIRPWRGSLNWWERLTRGGW